ncbi:MAG: cupin domain-containing protein [Candidatus Dormibacteraeota bacterium]|nr:cupin domain-containing protein [Candidatus Dormibacteraeota bacterium]
MEFTTLDEARQGARPAEAAHFTGAAGIRPVHRSAEPHPVNVAVVRFEPGVRNHWHSHGGGQLLHVIEGEGWVQARGEPARRVRPGESISTAAGEEHWHGATRQGPMAHLAVTIGETSWLEPSDEPGD